MVRPASTNDEFTPLSIAKALKDGGYHPIPIPYGEKGPRLNDWQNYQPRRQDFEANTLNIGLLAKHTPGIDVDVLDADLADRITAEALRRWPGALKRVGQHPKTMLLLRAEAPFKKRQTGKFYMPSGEKAEVEILADGQQAVGFGRHPSGCDYYWPGLSPTAVRREELPEITEAAADDFLVWCTQQIAAADGVPERGGSAAAPEGSGNKTTKLRIDTGAPVHDDTQERLTRVLKRAPNSLSRDDWMAVCMAVKHELGNAGREDFLAFSARYAGSDPKKDAKAWDGAKPDGRCGAGTVFTLLEDDGRDDAASSPGQKQQRASATSPGSTVTSQAGWTTPDSKMLHPERSQPPPFPSEAFGLWADWIADAARSKSAPPDYVAAGLLGVAASLIGNARSAGIHSGWSEPTILWLGIIGDPSAGKSPGLDAARALLRTVEREAQQEIAPKVDEWRERREIATLAEEEWKRTARGALKNKKPAPDKLPHADPGEEPWMPRLLLNDTTIERVATILSRQHKGVLLYRDELAGWLGNMERNAKGGSDRPFWLEAFGGKEYVVERQTREAVFVNHLSVSILGGVQPDRLASLLLTGDDDGLPARLLPIWPTPAPLQPLNEFAEKTEFADVLNARAIAGMRRLHGLKMVQHGDNDRRPWFIPFDREARDLLDEVRREARARECEADGLMKSFIGKVAGVTARLALVFAYLDWSLDGGDEPEKITNNHLGRAAHFMLEYAVPMAQRSYAEAAVPAEVRSAHRLARLIHTEGLTSFTPSEITTRKRAGLRTTAEVKIALNLLIDASWARAAFQRTKTKTREVYEVNPSVRGLS